MINYANNDVIVAPDGKWLDFVPPLPDPLPGHMLVRTYDRNPPIKVNDTTYETATLVPGTTNVYDVYRSGTSFRRLLWDSTNVIEIISANTSNITDMREMCFRCSNLMKTCLFDTSNVTDMYRMFCCYWSGRWGKLQELPAFNMSSVTNVEDFLSGQWEIESLPVLSMPNVTSLEAAFYYCKNLKYVPVWNVPNLTSMHRAFGWCHSLEEFPAWDVSKVTNFEQCFYDCESLKRVLFTNTNSAEDMSHMFAACYELNTMPDFVVDNVTEVDTMFQDCTKIPSGILNMYDKLSALGDQVTNHDRCFYRCGIGTTTGYAEYQQIPSDWK